MSQRSWWLLVALAVSQLSAGLLGPDAMIDGGLIGSGAELPQSRHDSSKDGSSSDEFMPAVPNPLRRLQANYNTETLPRGVSVITDCGCPGCCTLPLATVTKTVNLTSTNFCFFTTTTVTTTDITNVITQTTTSIITRTSNLRLVETITKRTTSTQLSIFYTTTVVTNTVVRFLTNLELATESTLTIATTASFISGQVTRLIPYFTPYTVFIDSTSVYNTQIVIGFSTSTLRTVVTIFGGRTVFATTSTTQTIQFSVSVPLPLVTTEFSTRTTSNNQIVFVQATVLPTSYTTSFAKTFFISSTNLIFSPYTATTVQFPGSPTALLTATSFITFSLLPP